MIITRAFQNHQPYLQARQLTAFCCLCSSIGTKSLKKLKQKTIFYLTIDKIIKNQICTFTSYHVFLHEHTLHLIQMSPFR